jgi:hypothetical protein
MDATERELLRAAIEAAIEKAGGPDALDTALRELGWAEMLETAPQDAVAIVFAALGRANGAATVLDDVVLSALGMTPRPDLAVLLPSFGTWRAPGRIDAEQLRGVGLTTGRAQTAAAVVVVCDAGRDACAVTVPRSELETRDAPGVDPDLDLRVVRAECAVAVETRFDATLWEAAVAAGRRAVAHQIAGACRAMLTLARSHALERVQFGRPIASFQAVRHRLADVLVAVETLEATLAVAADAPTDLTAALAKATAGRTARVTVANCQQVLAGLGFTTDHPFHRYMKRTMVLDGLFGSADAITLDLGRHVLAIRRVPTLIDL